MHERLVTKRFPLSSVRIVQRIALMPAFRVVLNFTHQFKKVWNDGDSQGKRL